jgi:hypothetical protein
MESGPARPERHPSAAFMGARNLQNWFSARGLGRHSGRAGRPVWDPLRRPNTCSWSWRSDGEPGSVSR